MPFGEPRESVATLELSDTALGVSAVWGKSFVSNGTTFGHVLDPRTGRPGQKAELAAVVMPDATSADALSTALLVRGAEMLPVLQARTPCLRAVVISPEARANRRVDSMGFPDLRISLSTQGQGSEAERGCGRER